MYGLLRLNKQRTNRGISDFTHCVAFPNFAGTFLFFSLPLQLETVGILRCLFFEPEYHIVHIIQSLLNMLCTVIKTTLLCAVCLVYFFFFSSLGNFALCCALTKLAHRRMEES
jgi:hypothetical protein